MSKDLMRPTSGFPAFTILTLLGVFALASIGKGSKLDEPLNAPVPLCIGEPDSFIVLSASTACFAPEVK